MNLNGYIGMVLVYSYMNLKNYIEMLLVYSYMNLKSYIEMVLVYSYMNLNGYIGMVLVYSWVILEWCWSTVGLYWNGVGSTVFLSEYIEYIRSGYNETCHW
jgi:hypothetical protein